MCTKIEQQSTLKDKIKVFANQVDKRRPKSQLRFLQKVFYKTHQKFLEEYKPYSSIDELVETGVYDCLTATSLYSSILEILGFNFKIVETNYHIFILAYVDGKEVLLETTDGFTGFISNKEEINNRIIKYQNGKPSTLLGRSSKYLEYDFHLLNEVQGYQLPGLIYFNQAVKEFNEHNWLTCRKLLDKSNKVYNSPRVSEIMNFVIMKTTEKSDNQMKQEADIRSLGDEEAVFYEH